MSNPNQNSSSNTWNWHPDLPIVNSPLFSWPINLIGTFKWFATSWFRFSMTLIIFLLSVLVWWALQPPVDTFRDFEVGWIAQILLRNFLLLILIAGGLHWYLHTGKKQGDDRKFIKREFLRNKRVFTLNDQVRDNMFWSTVSGVPIWSGYEALYMWAYSNGYIPQLSAYYSWLWIAVLIFMTPLWLSFHFYWVHRLLHWPPVYKRVHSLHHRNVHVGPWSGLSMHPVEHLGYFSSILVHIFVISHPIVMYFHLYLQALNPLASHSGYGELRSKEKTVLPLGVFFHQLHHRYFECNYGTADMPWDYWFGTFHNGNEEATRETQYRMMRKYQQ